MEGVKSHFLRFPLASRLSSKKFINAPGLVLSIPRGSDLGEDDWPAGCGFSLVGPRVGSPSRSQDFWF